MKQHILLLTVVLVALVQCVTLAADWKPQTAPVMTRWAKDVAPDKVLPEYPRPSLVREKWQNLNGLWQFEFTQGKAKLALGQDLKDKILVPFAPESALSGIMKHESEHLLYRRMFTVPKDWAGQRVLLHFGAVDWLATVIVNGKVVGTHQGGYDPFTFDISDALKPDGEQEIHVQVFDPTDKGFQPTGKQRLEQKGIWYTPISGIWQTVWLEPVPKSHVQRLNFSALPRSNEIEVVVDGVGGAKVADGVLFKYSVFDGDSEIANNIGPSEVVRLPIKSPKLWSPESPHLYRIRVQQDQDTVESYFAFRTVEMKKDEKGTNRLFLNGKPCFQVGLLDQGYWPDGLYTAPTDEALKFDIEVTKRLGFNLARKHMKLEPDRWYYWCDKLGLLVWQDMPSQFNETQSDEAKKNFEAEWKSIIDAVRFHPSIVAWVPFNEGWGQYDTERLAQWTKEYDPSRICDNPSGWVDKGVGDVVDAHIYPGPGAPKMEEKRAAVLGEFGGLGLRIEGHHWTQKNFSYNGMESPEELEEEFTRLFGRLWALHRDEGLSAAVYTQTTDVEGEINGLLTYDRELKVNVETIKAAVTGQIPLMKTVSVVPTSKDEPQEWKYTTDKPADDWESPSFDDSAWNPGPGGFGTEGTPGAVVRTKWDSSDIWIRRTVNLPADVDVKRLLVSFHHDENAEVFLNGKLASRRKRTVMDYEERVVAPEARAVLKAGEDVTIAAHCHQTVGGQYIDVGLVTVKEE